jgi:aspartyl-tRNA synthetase
LGLIEAKPQAFRFLWVTDFPLFSPDLHDKSDPGQEGIAGIRSTHHPFTAPQVEDLEHLINDPAKVEPLKVKGQHYDLVVNGVELGGGSVRIHDADLQHYVLKEILKVCPPILRSNCQLPDKRIRDFNHLLEALASGCPPHAGIALGISLPELY